MNWRDVLTADVKKNPLKNFQPTNAKKSTKTFLSKF